MSPSKNSDWLAHACEQARPVGMLQLQVERINQLPRTKQQFVMQDIDSVLGQAAR